MFEEDVILAGSGQRAKASLPRVGKTRRIPVRRESFVILTGPRNGLGRVGLEEHGTGQPMIIHCPQIVDQNSTERIFGLLEQRASDWRNRQPDVEAATCAAEVAVLMPLAVATHLVRRIETRPSSTRLVARQDPSACRRSKHPQAGKTGRLPSYPSRA